MNGYIYDLRFIPFMLGALYSGRKVAITLFLVMLFYQFMIGGSGLSTPTLQSFVLLLLTLYINLEFLMRTFRKKVLTAFWITAILSITTVLFYFIFLPTIIDRYLFKVLLNYSLILIITASVVVYIIEFILQNKKIGAEIIEAEKLRVVSELAASVSHEVRNPLTVTRGFIQLLYDPNIDKQKKEEFLNLSLQELDRAQEIISEYLAFAKPLEKSNFILLNVKAELFYIIQVMSPLADMLEITLKNEVEVEGLIIGEKQKFRQCLINLLKNSIEATTTRGEIVISASCTNDKVTISIKDFGVGMSRNQLARLGSPYHSTKENGTGLGTVVVFPK